MARDSAIQALQRQKLLRWRKIERSVQILYWVSRLGMRPLEGKIFPDNAKRKEWLHHYSRIFSTVEGNTTFYAIPTVETVRKWAEETEEDFRFALKFPRVISHDCRLVGCRLELGRFLECLEILDDAGRLGPTFLQLPPDFDHRSFPVLKNFLEELPENLPFAVEVRHDDYYQEPLESKFCDFLQTRNMDRVVFDSRPLFHFPPGDITESEARRRKPQLPLRNSALGRYPMLRFIGVNRVEKLHPWINEWAEQIVTWIKAGKTPYVFAHTPDDEFAPDFARLIHQQIRTLMPGLPDLPKLKEDCAKQLDLFSDE